MEVIFEVSPQTFLDIKSIIYQQISYQVKHNLQAVNPTAQKKIKSPKSQLSEGIELNAT